MQQIVIGIDIGGTKIAIRLENTAGEKLVSHVLPTNRASAIQLFTELCDAIHVLMNQHQIETSQIKRIGVGMPGIIDAQRGIALLQNNVPLENFPMRESLQQQFPQAKIAIENDVNVAALHEYKLRDFSTETMLFVTVSTGIAASIIFKGDILQQRGHASEIGFWKRGFKQTLEQDFAGPPFEKQLQNKLQTTASLRDILTSRFQEVEGEITEFVEHVAAALFEILLLINPHCIVIGGGLINGQKKLFDQLVEKIDSKINDIGIFKQQNIQIEQAIHKADSGVKGAILLVND